MLENVKLTLLAEDEAGGSRSEGSSGFSCWVEADGECVLFDAGRSDAALQKAQELGFDLAALRAVVLSHGHRANTGGLAELLGAYSLRVVAHPEFDAPHLVRASGTAIDVGVPEAVRALLASARLERQRSALEIVPGVWTSGEIPRLTDEDTGGSFLRDDTTPDPLLDDQALVVHHRAGLVVLLGCSHAGVVNTLRHVDALFPGRPLLALVGGMHLVDASAARVEQVGAEILARSARLVAPCHCSGALAQRWFESLLGARYRHLAVGSILAWDAGA